MSERTNGWKVELLDTLTRNPWFGVLLQKITYPDGSTAPYYTIDFPHRAVGIVVRRGDDFLFIRQYRFIVDEHVWAIPSGGVEKGESIADAAARSIGDHDPLDRACNPLGAQIVIIAEVLRRPHEREPGLVDTDRKASGRL